MKPIGVFGGTFDYIVSGVGDIDNGAETLGNADLFSGPGSGGQRIFIHLPGFTRWTLRRPGPPRNAGMV